jgi:hypothetical protein
MKKFIKKSMLIIGLLLIAGITFGLVSDSNVWVTKLLRLKSTATTTLEPKQVTLAAVLSIGRGSNYIVTPGAIGSITRIYVAPADTTPIMQGRIIYLTLSEDTITDGANLKLAGDLNGDACTIIGLIFKDSTWKEISRSKNTTD